MNFLPRHPRVLGIAFALAAVGLMMAALAAVPPGRAVAQEDGPRRYVDFVFDSVERTSDIIYGTAIDIPTGRSVDLRLDVYEPEGDTLEERPVFIFLFGGGFVSGDRVREPQAYCEMMARRGYVSIAIDYRLNQGNLATVGIPAAVSDARQAVGWVRANAEEHRLDVDRIGIGGSSAGAITSLFVAYTDLALEADAPSSEVAIVADLWGGLYAYVNDMETGEVPLVIVHGTADGVVPFSEATALRDRAETVGIPYAFHALEGVAHAPYTPGETTARIADFFYEQLWPEGVDPTAEPTTPAPTAAPPTTVPPTTEPPTRVPAVIPDATPTNAPFDPRIYLPLAENA